MDVGSRYQRYQRFDGGRLFVQQGQINSIESFSSENLCFLVQNKAAQKQLCSCSFH